jgi:hypothetical protein
MSWVTIKIYKVVTLAKLRRKRNEMNGENETVNENEIDNLQGSESISFLKAIKASLGTGIFKSDTTHMTQNMMFKTYQVIALCFAISLLIKIYISILGSPFKNKKDTFTFHRRNKICRNSVRTIGPGIQIDMCRGATDTSKHLDKKTQKKFIRLYEKFKRTNMSAHDSFVAAIKEISPNITPNVNFEGNGKKIKMCNMYNTMFSKEFKKICVEKNKI